MCFQMYQYKIDFIHLPFYFLMCFIIIHINISVSSILFVGFSLFHDQFARGLSILILFPDP